MLININGTIHTPETAKISVMDRGFLYGDGVYETMVAQEDTILFLDEHLLRLRDSAEGLLIPILLSDEEWKQELIKTIKAAGFKESVVRISVTRGEGALSLNVTPDLRPNWVIWVKEYRRLPSHCYSQGVSLTVSSVVRNDPRSLNPKLKTTNFLNNLLALMEAQKESTHEAILLNRDGAIAEGATSNIWMVYEGEIWTPPLNAGILPGITRSVLLQIIQHNGIPLREELFTLEELFEADECFITSSTREILPVSLVDSKMIGHQIPGPVTLKLAELYKESVKRYYGIRQNA